MTAQDTLSNVTAQIEALKNGEPIEQPEEIQEEMFDIEEEDIKEDVQDTEDSVEELSDDEEESDENPELKTALEHGYKPYDEYISDGGDPDMFRGPKAFIQYKEMEQKLKGQVKDTSKENDKLQTQMDELMSMFLAQQKAASQRHKQELEKALKQAKEDMDVDRVADITSELVSIEDEPEPENKEEPQVSLVPLQQLVNSNPIIDHTSDQFDPDVAQLLGNRIDRRASMEKNLSEDRLQAIITQEWQSVQEKMGLIKKRVTRKAPVTPAIDSPVKRQATKQIKLTKEEKQFYEAMKKTRPEAAKQYLKTVQERT